jgi:hypothetical protein
MKNNAPPASTLHLQAVAEELAHLLSNGSWHGFEPLFSTVADALCGREDAEPCRELLRLHVYGRLQNWLHHGDLEQQGDSYRLRGTALRDLETHAAAEHCRHLLETVIATGKADAAVAGESESK